jgi:nucleoside 2-deoxyribosyltransferase
MMDRVEQFDRMVYEQMERLSNLSATIATQATGQIEKLSENLIRLSTALTDQTINQARLLGEQQVRPSVVQDVVQEKGPTMAISDGQNKTTRHIQCMVAMPFRDEIYPYNKVLLPALRRVLERVPYYWEVAIASEEIFERIIQRNVVTWMNNADVYIADISDLNPSVMMELGYMLWNGYAEKPLLVLVREDRREECEKRVADLKGYLTIHYPLAASTDESEIDRLTRVLETHINSDKSIQELNRKKKADFLSETFLERDIITPEKAIKTLVRHYKSIEDIRDASDEEVYKLLKAIGLGDGAARSLKQDILARWKELCDS